MHKGILVGIVFIYLKLGLNGMAMKAMDQKASGAGGGGGGGGGGRGGGRGGGGRDPPHSFFLAPPPTPTPRLPS